MQRLEAFLTFALADVLRVDLLEVLGRNFEEPSWLDGEHLTHVLFGRHDELVVDDPLWVLVE